MTAKNFKKRTLEIIDNKIEMNLIRRSSVLNSINGVLPAEFRNFTTGTQIALLADKASKDNDGFIKVKLMEMENIAKENEELLNLRNEINGIC